MLLLAIVAALLAARPAAAELTIEITQGVDGALPIAVVPFDTSGLSGKLPADLAEIVANDLNRSGVLKSMPFNALPAQPHYSNQVRYPEWRAAGQDYLSTVADPVCTFSYQADTAPARTITYNSDTGAVAVAP